MKIYTHNYTKAALAERRLYTAGFLLRHDCKASAEEKIVEALQLLREYLSEDNMVEDGDCDGWVKYSDVENIMDPEKYV